MQDKHPDFLCPDCHPGFTFSDEEDEEEREDETELPMSQYSTELTISQSSITKLSTNKAKASTNIQQDATWDEYDSVHGKDHPKNAHLHRASTNQLSTNTNNKSVKAFSRNATATIEENKVSESERQSQIAIEFSKKLKTFESPGYITKEEKILRSKAVLKRDLESLLNADHLKEAQNLRCYHQLKEILNSRTEPPVHIFAGPAMELAKLIHENQCQDESCIHCQCEFKEKIVKLTSSSRRFVEMYKIACAQVIDKGKAEREKTGRRSSAKTGKKKFSSSIFTLGNAPKDFRLREEMVCFIFPFLFTYIA